MDLPTVHVHATGFGAFGSVDVNPSAVLVSELLLDAWASRTAADPPRHYARAVTLAPPAVLEVSTAAVDAELGALASRIRATARPRDTHVLLHFGVAAGAAAFSLEQVGVNDASFRLPDRRGLQLQGAPVDASDPLGCRRLSAVPCAALAHELRGCGHAVVASDNAGRFLCNWLAYRSLALAEALSSELAAAPGGASASGGGGCGGDAGGAIGGSAAPPCDEEAEPRVLSLFVHVPSFAPPSPPAAADGVAAAGGAADPGQSPPLEQAPPPPPPPPPAGLPVAAHVAFAVDLIRLLARILAPPPAPARTVEPATRDAAEATPGASDDDSDVGDDGLRAYARRLSPVLAQLAAATAAAAGCSGVRLSELSLPHAPSGGGDGPAHARAAALLAAADDAAKSADFDAAAALRAAAASSAPARDSSAAGPAAAAMLDVAAMPPSSSSSDSNSNSNSNSSALAAAVLAALQSAGFDGALCTRAVLATAPTGASTHGIGHAAASLPPVGGPHEEVCAAALADWAERALEWALVATEVEGEEGAPAAAEPARAPPGVQQQRAVAPAAARRPPPQLKLAIVLRGDLGMSPGKCAAQAAHAALKAARAAGATGAGRSLAAAWEASGEPIVVLRCADEAELAVLAQAGGAVGLPVCRVRDAGRTQVAPGSITCAAFGPADAAALDAVTGHLRLL